MSSGQISRDGQSYKVFGSMIFTHQVFFSSELYEEESRERGDGKRELIAILYLIVSRMCLHGLDNVGHRPGSVLPHRCFPVGLSQLYSLAPFYVSFFVTYLSSHHLNIPSRFYYICCSNYRFVLCPTYIRIISPNFLLTASPYYFRLHKKSRSNSLGYELPISEQDVRIQPPQEILHDLDIQANKTDFKQTPMGG